jgi:hypothetical protein
VSRDSEFNGKQPSFPISCAQPEVCYGLTKREYFAGLALQAAMANERIRAEIQRGEWGEGGDTLLAGYAIHMADALLAQLEPQP